MAWSTCPYCPIRLNGWDNMKRHQQKEHSTEYKTSEAQKQIGWAEERLARNTKAKEEYEVLDRYLLHPLHPNLPQLVVDIIVKEREKRQVSMYLKGERLVLPFDEQIAEDTEWLAQKRAELAALQPTEVTA